MQNTKSSPSRQSFRFLNIPVINEAEHRVISLLASLQHEFATNLSNVAAKFSETVDFRPIQWMRNGGAWGGGRRLQITSGNFFNRASVNFSHVNYTNEDGRALNSATALSTIIHPAHPCIPSIHVHLSYASMKQDKNYWRIMADLNPSLPDQTSKELFRNAIKSVTGASCAAGFEQGDKYFYIPALKRSRGISHFYLENFILDNFEQECQFAKAFVDKVFSVYPKIIEDILCQVKPEISHQQHLLQLEYHTLYFLQVMTLDRGTTAGLLVHDENDLGILASLPARIDIDLVDSWQRRMSGSHQTLVKEIVKSLGGAGEIEINDQEKKNLAAILRGFYKKFPSALELQAKGDVTPQTLKNHNAPLTEKKEPKLD